MQSNALTLSYGSSPICEEYFNGLASTAAVWELPLGHFMEGKACYHTTATDLIQASLLLQLVKMYSSILLSHLKQEDCESSGGYATPSRVSIAPPNEPIIPLEYYPLDIPYTVFNYFLKKTQDSQLY